MQRFPLTSSCVNSLISRNNLRALRMKTKREHFRCTVNSDKQKRQLCPVNHLNSWATQRTMTMIGRRCWGTERDWHSLRFDSISRAAPSCGVMRKLAVRCSSAARGRARVVFWQIFWNFCKVHTGNLFSTWTWRPLCLFTRYLYRASVFRVIRSGVRESDVVFLFGATWLERDLQRRI